MDRAGLDAVDDDGVDGQAVADEAVARDLVLGGRREVEVDEVVVGELRVDGEAEQAALGAVGLDDVLDDADRLGLQLAVLRQEPDPAGALGDQRAAVGEPVDRPRRVEPGGDGADLQVAVGAVAAAAAGQQHEHRDAGGAGGAWV